MTESVKVVTDAVDVVTKPLTDDLTNDPIDMLDIMGGGAVASLVSPVAEKLPFEKIASMSQYIPNADILEGFTELAAAGLLQNFTKNAGKGTTRKVIRKGGNMAQVGLGTLGTAKMIAGASKTIARLRGGATNAPTGNENQETSIWDASWQMF